METRQLIDQPNMLSRPIGLVQRISCYRWDPDSIVFVRFHFDPFERAAKLKTNRVGMLLKQLENDPRKRLVEN